MWIIRTLARHGVTLQADGDRLDVDAPEGVLKPLDWEILADAKPDLLTVLRGDRAAA